MSTCRTSSETSKISGRVLRVRGLVQGVGFRPFIFKLAKELGISGTVLNDGDGVQIEAWTDDETLHQFVDGIHKQLPALAKIDSIEVKNIEGSSPANDFAILHSQPGSANTPVAAEAATCSACIDDIRNRSKRRFRYPFTNCTHCGPRLSIIKAIPYDRANTSMSVFRLCPNCQAEYDDPLDRRYHAQPTACHDCGPKTHLRRSDGGAISIESLSQVDEVDAAATLILKGEIVAIKGLGGFQLCCDSTNHDAVNRLRKRKRRYDKPFALMARDIDVINCFVRTNETEAALLSSPSAPIVLLEALHESKISPAVAPSLSCLGFMLPNTPLHHLLMQRMDNPIVFTSGNLSDEPQCIDNEHAKERLGEIADYILENNRDIVNRVDDSVLFFAAKQPRLMRRARGYAPAPFKLPPGFPSNLQIFAAGAELKNTFCLLKNDSAILSQHIGDLADVLTFLDYQKNLSLYQNLFQHRPDYVAVDKHPEYLSTKVGKEMAAKDDLELHQIQHHHAHIAACLGENNWSLNGGKVLGVALDGLGYGDDGFWGGEFLLADYHSYERLGTFKPVALIGGAQAVYEPWRNTYAHILAEMGWGQYKMNFAELELSFFFETKPLELISSMLKSQTNVPLASSCGRLFDAVAAAIGICREKASYEGQAAIELESIADKDELARDDTLAYSFEISQLNANGIPHIEPLAMWQALLRDLALKTSKSIISARFHKGLARCIVNMLRQLSTVHGERTINTVALSGGVFQNKILLEQVITRLEADGFSVLSHRHTPSNDGGVALGQALICAARVDAKNKEGG